MTKRRIPSEEDFRRAEAADRERQRGLSEVRDCILSRFSGDDVCEAFVMYSPNANAFVAYIFFRWNRQIAEAEASGLISEIKEVLFDELENVGRGSRETIRVDFEFDSDENVEKHYGGDYYNRLR